MLIRFDGPLIGPCLAPHHSQFVKKITAKTADFVL
jgi:hypothetical protein